MVKNSNIYLLGIAVAFISLSLWGCKDDTLLAGDEYQSGIESPSGDELYMALRIYNAAAIDARSRAGQDPTYDSDGKDYTDSDNNKFNNGLASENAIYTGSTNGQDCPNFLLVFSPSKNADGTDNTTDGDKLEYLLPLFDWDYENNGKPKDDNSSTTTSGYNDYYTFYTSAKRHELPESFENRKVLVVLNASKKLKEELEKAQRSSKSYADILNIELEQDALKHKDKDFIYFTAPDGTKYFTMSSSMVVPLKSINTDSQTALTQQGYYGPAGVRRSFTWQKNKEEAVKYPILSLFLERMQSKYTLTIQNNSHTYYFADKTDWPESTEYTPVLPKQGLVIESKTLNNLEEKLRTIKYIRYYTRREDEPKYDDDYVKQFIKETSDFKINFVGWGINGVERKEHLFKKVNPRIGNYYPLTGGITWNPEDYSPYRNFWSEDPNYTSTSYPDQYSEAKKIEKGVIGGDVSSAITDAQIIKDGNVTSWDDVKNDNNRLDYFTFTQLVNHSPHQYSTENTYDVEELWPNQDLLKKAYEGRAYMRAGSHIILTSQLLIKGMEPEGLFENPSFNDYGWARNAKKDSTAFSKYYMNDIFWSERAYLEYVSEYLGYWMQRDEKTFGKNDGIFYVTKEEDRANATIADYEYFFIEPLLMEGSDGWAHIVPNLTNLKIDEKTVTDNTVVLYSYDPETNTYHDITRKDFEILAMSHPEYFAQHFNCGRMYYAIPISHQDTGNTTLYTGKYGAVRNHWYNFKITDIKHLGTPVSEPDKDLIIPNTDHSYESLGITLSVLPWHIIEESVDITQQRPQATPDQIDLDLKIRANDWKYQGKEEGI